MGGDEEWLTRMGGDVEWLVMHGWRCGMVGHAWVAMWNGRSCMGGDVEWSVMHGW